MFRVTLAPPAVRSWSSLPRWARTRFNAAFDLLEKDPRGTSADLDTHQLFGHRNVWTLRIPPYRGIYVIEGSEVVMIVFGRREVVYQRLHALVPPDRRAVSKTAVTKRR